MPIFRVMPVQSVGKIEQGVYLHTMGGLAPKLWHVYWIDGAKCWVEDCFSGYVWETSKAELEAKLRNRDLCVLVRQVAA